MSKAWLLAPLLSFMACASDEGGESKASGGASTGGDAGSSASGTGGSGGTAGGGGTGGSAPTGGSGGTSGYDCKHPHPAWLLCEDFENLGSGFQTWLSSSQWTDHIGGDDPGRMTSSNEAHGGGFALYLPAAASSGYQGGDDES